MTITNCSWKITTLLVATFVFFLCETGEIVAQSASDEPYMADNSDVMPLASAASTPSEAEALAFYLNLRKKHPDLPMVGDHSNPPHTIYIDAAGSPGNALLEMCLPSTLWKQLSQSDRDKLVVVLRVQIRDARTNPKKWCFYPPASPFYPAAIDDLTKMKDNAWEISVGQLDDEHYLGRGDSVLKGADYDISSKGSGVIVADPKTDAVYNSKLDNSVQQVKDYLSQNLNDANSVEYVQWTDVLKTGTGYRVSVTYRAKNVYGALILKDETFELDQKGTIARVTENG